VGVSGQEMTIPLIFSSSGLPQRKFFLSSWNYERVQTEWEGGR